MSPSWQAILLNIVLYLLLNQNNNQTIVTVSISLKEFLSYTVQSEIIFYTQKCIVGKRHELFWYSYGKGKEIYGKFSQQCTRKISMCPCLFWWYTWKYCWHTHVRCCFDHMITMWHLSKIKSH